ncbi:hypothetical protein BDD12DRAFT_872574 [Trichophaea hybrida]|nr:hypothetical protein BDD12DRAFT_872574 [Trichophaea hybrida]
MSELPPNKRWRSSLSAGDNWRHLRPVSTTPDGSKGTSSISVVENSPLGSPLFNVNPRPGYQRPKSAPPVDDESQQSTADGNYIHHDPNQPESSVTCLSTCSSSLTAPSTDLPVAVSPAAAIPEILVLPVVGTADGGNDTPQQETAKSPGYILKNSIFLEALKRYQHSLSEEERKDFNLATNTTPDSLIQAVKEWDDTHAEKSSSRRAVGRVEKILKGVDQFMNVMCICIQHNPNISALVLGLKFAKFFEQFTEMLERIQNHLSYISIYAELVFTCPALLVKELHGTGDLKSHSIEDPEQEEITEPAPIFRPEKMLKPEETFKSVGDALSRTYGDLLKLCCEARTVFLGKSQRCTSIQIFLRTLWDPYTNKFSAIEKTFLENAALVEKEAFAWIHLMKLDDRVQKLRKRERDMEKQAFLDAVNAQEEEGKRYGNTGTWLLENSDYRCWLRANESKLLWCFGNPGVGKTVLASIVVEDISKRHPISQRTGIAFAYCSYRDEAAARDPKKFLATFILQLARQRKNIFPSLVDLYATHRRDARKPSFSTLRKVFCSMLENFDTLFLLYDALDECEMRQELVEFLHDLFSIPSSCCIKLFVTSRKEPDIERAFRDTKKVEIAAIRVAPDIKAYVDYELQKRLQNGNLIIQDLGLKDAILDNLCNRAGGMCGINWIIFAFKASCNRMLEFEIP